MRRKDVCSVNKGVMSIALRGVLAFVSITNTESIKGVRLMSIEGVMGGLQARRQLA